MEKNKIMMSAIIALLVILLGTVVAVTIYLVSVFGATDQTVGDGFPGVTVGTRTPSIREMYYIELDTIRTNLLEGPGGHPRFVMTDVIILFDATAENRDITAFRQYFSTAIARSIIGDILYNSTYAFVRTPEGRTALEEHILHELQNRFETNMIVSVMFTDWAVM